MPDQLGLPRWIGGFVLVRPCPLNTGAISCLLAGSVGRLDGAIGTPLSDSIRPRLTKSGFAAPDGPQGVAHVQAHSSANRWLRSV